jgi:hypothetical protein
MTDPLIDMAEKQAQHDHQEAREFRDTAKALHEQATQTWGEARETQLAGHRDEAEKQRGLAGQLEETATDYDRRASQIDLAGNIASGEASAARAREALTYDLSEARERAEDARTDLREDSRSPDASPQDRLHTDLVAKGGAAMGEVGALDARRDELTDEIVSDIDLELKLRTWAHDGPPVAPHAEWGEGPARGHEPDATPPD